MILNGYKLSSKFEKVPVYVDSLHYFCIFTKSSLLKKRTLPRIGSIDISEEEISRQKYRHDLYFELAEKIFIGNV